MTVINRCSQKYIVISREILNTKIKKIQNKIQGTPSNDNLKYENIYFVKEPLIPQIGALAISQLGEAYAFRSAFKKLVNDSSA